MRPAPLGLLALCFLALAPLRAQGEPYNGGAAIAMFPSGVRVPFCIVPQADSGALVLYQDTRAGAYDIYAQRVDRRGRPTLTSSGRLVLTGLLGGSINGFVPDGAGGCIIVWSQYRGSTGQDVLVQRVLFDGTLAYAASGLVVCNASRDQTYPQVAAGPVGSYFVTWTDDRANVAGQHDTYVQRVTNTGAIVFAANGIAVNTAAFRMPAYANAHIAADLANGLLLAWNVNGGGLRAQRVSSGGAMQFGATGVTLGDPADLDPTIAADGSGGLWATTIRYSAGWTPYAHHLNGAGTSAFAPAGIAYHSLSPNGFNISPVRNASGGCFFLINEGPGVGQNGGAFFRQEMDASGALLRGVDGELLSYNVALYALTEAPPYVLLGLQEHVNGGAGRILRLQRFAFDGTPAFPGLGVVCGRDELMARSTAIAMNATNTGLVMESHADGRYARPGNEYFYQAFGQALDINGNPLWDDAENPVISSAKDAPGDQGGLVRVAWDASAADSPSARMARGYRGWRALSGTAAASLAALRPAADEPVAMGGRRIVLHANLYWEMVAEAPAAQSPSYARTLPTGQDSTAGGNADESFMIEAYDDSLHHWWSAALSAHSVDNLAPAAPAPFTGEYAAGASHLHWNPNAEPDLAGYRLYRGSTPGFVPGPGNQVASPPDTGWTDPAGTPAIYKLSAVDVHGNESPFATLTPNGALGVGDGTPTEIAFALSSTNPAHAGVTLRLALPTAARVRLAVYDASGREVRTLADGMRPAGVWTVAWDGTDATGRTASSGLYFARLESAGRSFTLRLALTR